MLSTVINATITPIIIVPNMVLVIKPIDDIVEFHGYEGIACTSLLNP